MTDERPRWARLIREERTSRDWSQAQAVRAMRDHSRRTLPDDSALIRNWKSWEAGLAEPDDFYKPLIAKTLGTVSGAIFSAGSRPVAAGMLLAGTGMDTLEVASRLRRSDVGQDTLDALAVTTDRLCSE